MRNISCDFSDIDQCGYVDLSHSSDRWSRKCKSGQSIIYLEFFLYKSINKYNLWATSNVWIFQKPSSLNNWAIIFKMQFHFLMLFAICILYKYIVWRAQMIGFIKTLWFYMLLGILHNLTIIMQSCVKVLNTWDACQVYSDDFGSKIKSILTSAL